MQSISLGDVSLAYEDRGRGTPLVLVHGFPLDHTMWSAQFALALEARVIAPDLRGFGQSTVCSPAVTMELFADDLAALVDRVVPGERVVLCGLSMGGYVALAFWRKYAARLRGLVLCDTRAAADSPEGVIGRRQMADRVLREGMRPVVEAMQPRMFSPRTFSSQPQVVDAWQRIVLRCVPQGVAAAALGMARREDASSWLGEIRCPTLVVVGADDVTSPPAEMRGMAEAIPSARYVEIPAAGHLSPLENPAAFHAALAEFLAAV